MDGLDLRTLPLVYQKLQTLPLEQRLEAVSSVLASLQDQGYYFYLQQIENVRGARAWINGREKLVLASYDYLGLTAHPEIKRAAIRAIEKYGTGTGGVRLLAGTFDLHAQLERRIAEFKGTEAAVVFSSGFMTNVAFFATLFGERDYLVVDKLCHASIIDGCRLAGGRLRSFQHNNVADLEVVLKTVRGEATETSSIVVVVDAIYSMDGDIAPLPEICRVAGQYGAKVLVDEAHSLGVLGETGRGIDEHFNVRGVDYFMGSLSKAIPSIGGYIAADGKTIEYLKHYARPFIFSASLPPSAVASALAAFDVMVTEGWRRTRLWRNQKALSEGLRAMGFDLLASNSPIIPVVFRDPAMTLEFCRFLDENGVFICPILFPAVPLHASRLRGHVMASHSLDDLELCLDLFRKGRELLGREPAAGAAQETGASWEPC
jgi:glycine C-acetyltransferase